jgi:Formin Homology 2 Domain
VETACDELSNSVRLRKLLGIVLNIGNRLNTAGVSSKQKAGAFKLESLLKLSQAKAFDKKTTFLHYIVLVVQRNNELLLRFKDDLPTVLKADKVYWDQCVTDLEEVENQLENVRRIALNQARLALSYRIKKTKSRNTDDDGESFSDCSMSLEEEVELLRATPIGIFTLAAIKKVSTLRDKVEATKAKFAKLLEYFGEDDKQDMQPHVLFNIMVTFCKDFERAKEQVYASTKAKMREDRKTQVSNKNVPPSPQTPVRPTPPKAKEPALRLSSLQPNMSTVMKAKSPDAQLREESRRKSPKHSNDGYSKEPPPGVVRSPNSLQQANAAARPHNGQYSKQPSPALTRPQNGPYSKQPGPVLTSPQNGYSKQLAPMAPTYSRSPTEANQPLADANDETSVGSGASPRSKVLGSPILTYDPNSSMRQKARMQRQRMSGRSSVSSSTSVTSSTTGTSNASVARPPLDQTKQQQLSPRSSIRQRRRTEIRRSRDGAGTEWPDTTDQISEQLEVD